MYQERKNKNRNKKTHKVYRSKSYIKNINKRTETWKLDKELPPDGINDWARLLVWSFNFMLLLNCRELDA